MANTEISENHAEMGRFDREAAQGALWRLALLGVGAVVLGTLVAPLLFQGMVAVSRSVEGLASLRELAFTRVTTRCVLILLVIGGLTLFRRGALGNHVHLGLLRTPGWSKGLVAGFIFGVVSMLLVFAHGLAAGAHLLPDSLQGDHIAGLLTFLVSGLLVAVIEEVLFRGVLYGSLRAVGGVWLAALVSSLIFSAVHFATPVPAVGIAHAHWYSGLALIPDLFRRVHATHYYFPFCISLFMMGIVLCFLYERTRSLYVAIGLHAGWIWALYGIGGILTRDPRVMPAWFGVGDEVAKGMGVLAILSALAVALIVARKPGGKGNDEGRMTNDEVPKLEGMSKSE